MHDGAELLIDPPYVRQAAAWVQRLRDSSPAGTRFSSHYTGKRRLLVLYGVGLPSRQRARSAHLKAGGRVAMWDLGYWDRARSMRLSIDSDHPKPEHLAACGGDPERARPALAPDGAFDPNGPILLCGLGPKSCTALDLQPLEWERSKLADLRVRFPGRSIIWRPKPGQRTELARLPVSQGPIEGAIQGCSLVVCRHSNVAVDACIAGVPVECDGGAAWALYRDEANPDRGDREAFLRRLAWFNWSEDEAPAAWRFIGEMTCD